MGKLLQTLTLAGVTCCAFIMAPPAQAQDSTTKSDKLGEYDEIIIKQKNNQDGKVTIEIKDGEVWVDGKKLEHYKDGDLSVYRRRITPRDGNAFSFSNPRRSLQFFNNEDNMIRGGRALLGVITEKKEAAGVTVREVSEGSAAEKAGIKTGDVITGVDADKIAEPQDLFEKISEYDPGDKVTVTYLRNGKENKATVTLGERKDTRVFNFTPPGPGNSDQLFRFHGPRGGQGFGDRFNWFGDDSKEARLGLSVQDTENREGARVLEITEGSAAAKAGFREDDIITEMAGTEVRSAKDVVNAYRDHQDKETITAKVKRNNKVQQITIDVPRKLNKADL
ncbi:PDZ domain-containing protein [Chitinophaga japonensis]|uniref:Serine protease Do n=1 Tax=Chitinophaga japonensis TaxID=104662 RepID=A0A562TD19_CHIJA|nr:PDZ domain-containing protein [Chitinophaga japonensis]TWI91402.1 serine protease Do [Chitinophaga japonensis]